MTSDQRVIKSYVWHGDQCFFVSTIERDCSAMLASGLRYNETLVWPYDWEKHEQGERFVDQRADCRGSIQTHLQVCQQFFEHGKPKEEDDSN